MENHWALSLLQIAAQRVVGTIWVGWAAKLGDHQMVYWLLAIPLVAMKRFGVKAPLWLKLAAVSGLVVSLVAAYFTLIPITTVSNPLMFALKIIAVVLGANVIGVVLYKLRKG